MRFNRRITRLSLVAGLAAFGLGLAACGSSSPSASSTTTSTTTTAPDVGQPGAQTSSQQLESLTSLSTNAKTATFKAVYTYTASGKTQTITFAQAPPKYLFQVGTSGLTVNDGSKTYYCAASHCLASTSSSDPLLSISTLFNGTTFADSVRAYTVTAAALAAIGVTLTFSTASHAGVASKCVHVTDSKTGSKTFTWCVAAQSGLMDYWSAGTSSFALTSFTTSPPASDFTVPAGYTIVTIP
jgi:hypothetical protein